MPNYFITDDFTAPKYNTEANGDRLQRLFRKGEYIGGNPNGYAVYKGKPVKVIKEADGYVIPIMYVKKVETVFDSDTGEAHEKVNKDVANIVNKNLASDILDTARKSMTGLTIGAFGGFAIALMKGKSLLWYGLIGGVSGGLIGYGISKTIINKKI